MKKAVHRSSKFSRLAHSARCAKARLMSRVAGRMAVALAAVGAGVLLSGCDSWAGTETSTMAASGRKSAYLDRKVGDTYEGISLNHDGTYSRTIVDNYGRAYQQQGTWRGYGGTYQNGKGSVSKRIELDGYADTRDLINKGSTQDASKTTKTLSPGDFYSH